jgi:hypothetical protein
MTSIFTPRKFQNYCYVVKSEDGNSYDIGVFMEFKSLKQYFKKTMDWKFNKLITEEQFIKMCCDNYIIVDKMEIIDYNDDEDDEDKRELLGICKFCVTDIFEDIEYCAKCNSVCCVDCVEVSSTNGTNKKMCIKCYNNMCRSCSFKYVNDEQSFISCKKCIKKISNIKHKFN